MGKEAIATCLLLACSPIWSQQKDPARKIACKTPATAQSCYWTHGRLTFCCGTPAVRVWKIGTHRVLGIYSGPEAFDSNRGEIIDGDNENPAMPTNLEIAVSEFRKRMNENPAVFGDFELCPLEPEKSKTMQAACIESAKDFILR
jgi:hypothetical protein